MKLKILYEDNDILVVYKPSGISSQQERGRGMDMVSLIRNYLCIKGKNNIEPYVIHRLDKPVAGVMVYALNKKAAAALSNDMQKKQIAKNYYAIVCNVPENYGDDDKEHELVDKIKRVGNNMSEIVSVDADDKEAKIARLKYRIVKSFMKNEERLYLVDINLITGRYHQIRAQFANAKASLYGDLKYGNNVQTGLQKEGVALCAYKLTFSHPLTKKEMEFSIVPDNSIFDKAFSE